MAIPYSWFDLTLYLLLYSFLGWAIEVCCFSLRDKQFVNRGFLNVPFALPYGITAVILIVVLPTLNGHGVLQYFLCYIVFYLIMSLTEQFLRGVRREGRKKPISGQPRHRLREALITAVIACAYLVMYLLVHPLLFTLVLILPDLLVKIVVIVCWVLVAVDFVCVLYSLRSHSTTLGGEARLAGTSLIANRMRRAVRRRLEKNYPGILAQQDSPDQAHVFAKGICFDKLAWVFLVSSFLGALIEMVFVRVTSGVWMSRSSVLYGAFSFVWGFGAVLLTIVLQPLAGKADRYVFLAGFVVGGAYEYLASVFTEIVFGTVFWDYSHMPLNIGGRTNVLYCIFWGLLAVAWIKIAYLPMSRCIEKIPALFGKILTWIVVILMICNGILTSAAMIRYSARQEDPTAGNPAEQYLDQRYDDAYMEARWPNMVIPEE